MPSHSADTTYSKGRSKRRHGEHQHGHTKQPESNDVPTSPPTSADPPARTAPGTTAAVSPPGAPSPSSPQHADLGCVVKKGDLSSAESVHDPSQGSPAQDAHQPSKPLLFGSRTVLFPRPSKVSVAERLAASSAKGPTSSESCGPMSPSGRVVPFHVGAATTARNKAWPGLRRPGESTVTGSGSPILNAAPPPSPWQVVDGWVDEPSRARYRLLNQDAPQFMRDLAIYDNPSENVRRPGESTVTGSGSPILNAAPPPSPWQVVDGWVDEPSRARYRLLNQDAPQFMRDLAIYDNPSENVEFRKLSKTSVESAAVWLTQKFWWARLTGWHNHTLDICTGGDMD
ncbi:hypothetical protein HPB51_006964 [Rhipicephalus microplus]|uniref:Uncharacterized protein n=1 Tax=Rhipicephalus microplus TaxID=6941 RepID=A0A9J6ERV0_RHIMP|nr:hypothetical protein HPB51_006964 [Rhipicephalus microplus]